MSVRSEQTRVVARKIGVQLKPPALILLYRREGNQRGVSRAEEAAAGDWRKRIMPLRRFTVNADLALRRQELQERHRPYLDGVSDILVEKMLSLLQETLTGQSLSEAQARTEKRYTILPNEDLNQANPDELATKKRVMELEFLRNNIPPGDPRFEYDKQVEFFQASQETSPWDEDDGVAYDTVEKGKSNSVNPILLASPDAEDKAQDDEDNFWD